MKGPRRVPSWVLVLATAAICIGALQLDRANWFENFRFALEWTPSALASTRALPQIEVVSGLPTLSLAMEDADLNSPDRGLLANKLEHGPEWERPGSISYFEGGRLLFASGVGVRIHGGGSRITSPRQGFRLYFRRRYGAREFAPGILFEPDAQPIRRLVVHNDARTDPNDVSWHLVNPLAYDVARAMGAIAPQTKPARFFVNGEYYGVFVLTERVDERFFNTHWGYDDIEYGQEAFDSLWEWVNRTPMTMEALSEQIDLENLTRWFLAVAFCATTDSYQGPSQFLDLTRTDRRWFWVNWDMDLSFHDWTLDSYQYLLEVIGERRRGRNRAEPRSLLLTRLLAENDQYRAYFKRVFQHVMNHRVTPQFLEERYQHYLHEATRLRVEDPSYLPLLHEFLAARPAFFRRITEQWLNEPPSQPLSVVAPAARSLIIDGESVAGGFQGLYFQDLDVALEIPSADRAQFSEWLVNGRPVGQDPQLTIKVDRPTRVEARFGDERGTPAGEPGFDSADAASSPPVGPSLVWQRIPAGTFWMGCVPVDEECGTDDVPRQEAQIDQPFEMTEREISAGDFEAFTIMTGRQMPRQPDWYADRAHPVVNVTWDEAQAFCDWAGGSLPSEAQWEYAARGGTDGRIFPWGNEFGGEANARDSGGADQWEFTAPAEAFEPNGLGLRNMAGNVWEWTSDVYLPPRDPPSGSGLVEERTIRGGSWVNTPSRLRLSYRLGLVRGGRHNLYVGFRCIRPLPSGTSSALAR